MTHLSAFLAMGNGLSGLGHEGKQGRETRFYSGQ